VAGSSIGARFPAAKPPGAHAPKTKPAPRIRFGRVWPLPRGERAAERSPDKSCEHLALECRLASSGAPRLARDSRRPSRQARTLPRRSPRRGLDSAEFGRRRARGAAPTDGRRCPEVEAPRFAAARAPRRRSGSAHGPSRCADLKQRAAARRVRRDRRERASCADGAARETRRALTRRLASVRLGPRPREESGAQLHGEPCGQPRGETGPQPRDETVAQLRDASGAQLRDEPGAPPRGDGSHCEMNSAVARPRAR
jgi:hypothetical protein